MQQSRRALSLTRMLEQRRLAIADDERLVKESDGRHALEHEATLGVAHGGALLLEHGHVLVDRVEHVGRLRVLEREKVRLVVLRVRRAAPRRAAPRRARLRTRRATGKQNADAPQLPPSRTFSKTYGASRLLAFILIVSPACTMSSSPLAAASSSAPRSYLPMRVTCRSGRRRIGWRMSSPSNTTEWLHTFKRPACFLRACVHARVRACVRVQHNKRNTCCWRCWRPRARLAASLGRFGLGKVLGAKVLDEELVLLEQQQTETLDSAEHRRRSLAARQRKEIITRSERHSSSVYGFGFGVLRRC